VRDDPAPATYVADWHKNIDRVIVGWPGDDPPHERCRLMAEHCFGTDGQQGRRLTSEGLRRRMTHRVDTPVSLQKPAVCKHAIDRSRLDARGEKLPP
jgi:hypothetical protein